MNTMTSINQFFSEIGCHFQCYNMGRLIQAVNNQTFIDFESNKLAWQTPFLQNAWLAIIFWQDSEQVKTSTSTHYVWFLKLPLDEQAKLNLAARDDFLRRLLEALGNYLDDARHHKHQTTADKLQSLESAMKDNPYGFQPKDEQMANFHAIVHKQLALPASQYYQTTQQYFSGENNFSQWSQLGFQGIADYAARLDESCNNKTNEQLLIKNLEILPFTPFQAVAGCLENQQISSSLTQAIYQKLQNTLEQADNKQLEAVALCISTVRASAQSVDQTLHRQLLNTVLHSKAGRDVEVLATIAGRCWPLIVHPDILPAFLEALANTTFVQQESNSLKQQYAQRQAAFNAIVSDLMFIPGIRDHFLEKFRSPERSEQLTQAIGTFFSHNF